MTDNKNNMSSLAPNKSKVIAGAISAVVLLSGCTQMAVPDMTTTNSVFGTSQSPAFEHTLSETRSVNEAFVEFPDASGSVLEVTQSKYGNGVEQTIVYQGDNSTRGQNIARVLVVAKSSAFGSKSQSLKIPPTSATQIRKEMRKALPGVNMRISNEFHNNAYGPFGYAFGHASGGNRCLYGWQKMKGQGKDRWALWRGESQKPELSVRLRVCRSGASADELVNLMRNLRVNVDPETAMKPSRVSWNAGQGGNLSSAMPSSEPAGYVSDQQFVEPEPASVRHATPRPSVAKKRVIRKHRRAIKRAQAPIVPTAVEQRTYPTPVYAGQTAQKPSSTSVGLVPTPGQIAPSPAVKARAVETLNAPTPVYISPVKTMAPQTVASSYPVVPMPK